MNKIILDLCGGTGAWSRPYKEAGYEVRNITWPEYDVREYDPPDDVYGVLAAPPCTHFTNSGAQYWKKKDADGRTIAGMGLVMACLMIIAKCRPKFWALENPIGRLPRWIGKYKMTFNPCDYGDPYTKKTCLWGVFNEPKKNPVEPEYVICPTNGDRYSKVHWFTGGTSEKTKRLRSITPAGFAKAFYEANK